MLGLMKGSAFMAGAGVICISDCLGVSKRMVAFLCSILLLVSMLLPSIPAHAAGLRFMSEDFPPYSYLENDEPRGLFVDMIREIQRTLGEEPARITYYPWARGYKNLFMGIGDVLFPMAVTPERSHLFKFVGPVFWDDVYFYRRKGSGIHITSMDDARQVGKIAVTRNDVYHLHLKNMGFTNLDVSSSQKSDFMKLLKGRVDLVPMGRKILPFFLKSKPDLDPDDFERVGPPIFFTSCYLAFSRATPDEVIKRWQNALDELKKTGVWLKIMDKYFPPEYSGTGNKKSSPHRKIQGALLFTVT